MKYLAIILLTVASTSTFAGGTSSIGNAPLNIEYFCQDSSGNVTVSVGTSGDGGSLMLSVSTNVPSFNFSDTNVTQTQDPAIGAPLVFAGDRFSLTLNVDGPIYRNGQSSISAQLTDNSTAVAGQAGQPVPICSSSSLSPGGSSDGGPGCVQPPTLQVTCSTP